jgi:hypothetical protein
MRAFAVWTGWVLIATAACGSDPEPQPVAISMSGVGGGGAGTSATPSGAAGKPAAGSGAAGSVAATGGAGAGVMGAAGRAGSMAAGRGAAGASGASAGTGGAGGGGGTGGSSGAGGTAGAAGSGGATGAKFSFFVTSLSGMIDLAKNPQGFGGDLKFGEATGLAGADKICTTLAEKSMPGSGAKGWRAFLSAAKGGANGGPVHARDRIGAGPWYDRLGRLIANDVNSLVSERPTGADSMIRDDLPNERGEPNHTDTMQGMDDNHDTVTGSNATGMYDAANGNTCNDWTSTAMSGEKGPMVGHSWPAQSGKSWIRAHNAPGCAPSVGLVQMGGGSGDGIGNAGGYGGFYCFALKP